MASSNLATKIQDLIGKIDQNNYTAVSEWLTQSSRDVINVLPKDMLWTVATNVDCPDENTGATLTTAKILHVHKSGVKAREINPADKTRISNSNSIFKPSTNDPKYYRENGKVFVLPGGGTVVAVNYPTVTYNQQSITGVPKDIEYIIILGASVKGRMFQLDVLRRTIDSLSLPLIDSNKLQVLLAPSPVITDITISSSPPTFNAPNFPNITDLSLAAIQNDIPDIGGEGLQDLAMGALPTAPEYQKPVFSAPTFPTITALDLSGIDGEIPDPMGLSLQNYELGNLPTAPTYTEVSISVGSTAIADAFTSMKTALDDDDIEKGQGYIQQVQAHVNQMQSEMTDEMNKFNQANTVYQASLQKLIADAQAKQSEDTNELVKLRDDMNRYQAKVNAKVQEYQNNELQNKFQRYVTDYSNALQQYSLDMQNSLNAFNDGNTEYQAKIQKLIQEATSRQSEDTLKLTKLRDQLGRYSQLVNDKVVTFQQNEIQNKFQKWVTEYQNKLAEYNASISLYNANISKEVQQYQLNEVQKEMALYIQKENDKIQKANLEANSELSRFNNELSKYQAQVSTTFQKYSGMFQELNILQSQYQGALSNLVQPYISPRGAEDGK
tara:strand:- start:235 stop:2064 length:1830 start_codon:yes stop_codon:yes gene_type:complete